MSKGKLKFKKIIRLASEGTKPTYAVTDDGLDVGSVFVDDIGKYGFCSDYFDGFFTADELREIAAFLDGLNGGGENA